MADWVELRVHGVSGTPPEAMLNAPVTVQVAGDSLGRFLRPAAGDGTPLEPSETGGRVLEAYHWGLFTSGSFTQGLWFLLIPFGMLNAAAFMLPPGPRWTLGAARAALRLLGLALTAVLILGTVHVFVEALAWSGPGEGRLLWLLAAVAACVVVLVTLTVIGRDQIPAPPPGPSGSLPEPKDDGLRAYTGLARKGFYFGAPDVPLLRRLHVAVGALVIALPFAAMRRQAMGDASLSWTVAILLFLTAVAVLFLGNPRLEAPMRIAGAPDSEEIPTASLPWQAVTTGLPLGAVVVLVLSLVGLGDLPHEPNGLLPGLSALALALVIVGLATLTVLFVVVLIAAASGDGTEKVPEDHAAGTPKPFRPFAGGLTTWALAAVGTFVGLGFAVGLSYTTAWLLGRAGHAVTVPAVHERIAYCWGITACVLVLLGMAAWIWRGMYVRRHRDRIAAAYAKVADASAETTRQFYVGPATAGSWKGRLKLQVGWVIPLFAGLGLLLCLGLALELRAEGDPREVPAFLRWAVTPDGAAEPVALLGWLSERPVDAMGWLIPVGNVLLVVLAGGLLLAGRGAVLNKGVRRVVNVVWDVVAFWPREAHPIVPPPYSQRAVRDLADRITWHLEQGKARRLLLAAHSQGSVIAVAALLRVPVTWHGRIALITHGSQLQYAYSRAFPRYINPRLLRWVLATLRGRWINLFRESDHVGGHVLSWDRSPENGPGPLCSSRLTSSGVEHGPDRPGPHGVRCCGPEWRLLDPAVVDSQAERWRGVAAHSNMPGDPAWDDAVEAVWGPFPRPPQSDAVAGRSSSCVHEVDRPDQRRVSHAQAGLPADE